MEPQIADHQASSARKVLISFSPRAGRRSAEPRVRAILAELTQAGYSAQSTCDLAELRELASKTHRSRELYCVIACGGDGSAAVVRNNTPLAVPLLTVPLGTENLLGRYLAHSTAPDKIRDTVDQGISIDLDLGRVSCAQHGSRYFLLMVSAGFDAEVVRRLHVNRQGNITRLSYVQPTLTTIQSYEYPELQLYCDQFAGSESSVGGPMQAAEPIRCRWAFGFNLPLYARGWRVAPDADALDGLVDVCTFERGSIRNVVRYLWHVIRQSHLRLGDANLVRTPKLRIESADGADVAYQVDGDFGGTLPVEIEVLPRQLRLLVMPHVAERLGFRTTG
jgi:diacylglycerol kinase (ATP)